MAKGGNSSGQNDLGQKLDELSRRLGLLINIFAQANNLTPIAFPTTPPGGGGPPPGPSESGGFKMPKGLEAVLGFFQEMPSVLTTLSRASILATESVTALVGSFQQFTRFAELFDPGQVFLFELATRDLFATIGEMLMPVVVRATEMFRLLGDVIDGLGPNAKLFVAVMAAVGASLVAGAVAAGVFAAGMALATGGISAIAGAIAGAAAGLTTFAAFAASTSNIMEALSRPLAAFGQVLEIVGQITEKIVDQMAPGIEAGAEIVAVLFQLTAALMESSGIMDRFMVVIEMWADGMRFMLEMLKAVVDFLEQAGVIDPIKMGSSTGKATAQATFMGSQQYAESAYKSAFSLGQMSDREEQRRDRQTMIAHVARIREIAERWIGTITKPVEKAAEIYNKPSGIPGVSFGDFGLGILSPGALLFKKMMGR